MKVRDLYLFCLSSFIFISLFIFLICDVSPIMLLFIRTEIVLSSYIPNGSEFLCRDALFAPFPGHPYGLVGC